MLTASQPKYALNRQGTFRGRGGGEAARPSGKGSGRAPSRPSPYGLFALDRVKETKYALGEQGRGRGVVCRE